MIGDLVYMIADEKDRTIHWGYAGDEGYGRDPYIALDIQIKPKKTQTWRLDLKKPNECRAIAAMLKSLAEEIEQHVTTFEERRDFKP